MKRRKFSLSHYRLLSCAQGSLIPVTWFEVLPGDTIQHAISALVRAAPMVTPAMHVLEVRFHTFFVPNRIMWTTGGDGGQGWESYITGGATGTDAQVHPVIASASMAGAVGNNAGVSTLADFLGVPTSGLAANTSFNALPFRAYQMIFNEFYRDQNLQTLAVVSTATGNDTTTSTSIENCCWEKDYLTTTRPTESLGPSVNIFTPGASVPLAMNTTSTATTHATYPGTPAQGANSSSPQPIQAYDATTDTAVAGTSWFAYLGSPSNANLIDINNLRHQFAIQRYQEARMFYGSRYTEYLAYLGVRAADSRLQRPEYLGGGRSTIQISEVMQTSVTTSGGSAGGAGGVGQYGGHGISGMRANRYRKFFPEHGIVMTLMSIRPRTMYSQRVRREFLRGQSLLGLAGSKEDYWQKELERIGQQQVNGLECDAQVGIGTSFGFQDRYDEYRRMESSVHGQFRSTLDTWHLSREFASAPSLNATFVSCVPSKRIFADTTNDNAYVMTNHHIVARRLVGRGSGIGRVF